MADGCLLDSTNVSNPLAFEGVDCRLGNVPPHYVSSSGIVLSFIRGIECIYVDDKITVQSVTDVQAALAFSKFTGVRLSVKNKGHDFLGRSSGMDTLSLWVSMNSSISIIQEVA